MKKEKMLVEPTGIVFLI